jgi:uncharacterized protein YjdB
MVGNALAYGHRRGVVHRDVKPANILIDEDGNAVVTDFGIAKLVVRENGVPRASRGGETQTGVIVGTPTYMSPEQCLARPVSAASDQYSLGLVAYELLTGRPPFSGSPFVVMHAHTEKPAPSVREHRPDCEPELDAAVQRMLAKDPVQRWPTVQHALAALGAAPLGDADPARAELAGLSMPAPFRRSDEVLRPAVITPTPAVGAPEVKPYIAAIEIFAPPTVIEVGDSFTLTGSPRNPSGDTVPGVKLRWSSSNEQIATVDETRGTVHAVSAGDVEITATASGVNNTVRMNIVPKRVALISVSLPPGVLHAGDRVQLVATPEDKRHDPVSTAVHWASADESIAIVSQEGVVSAKAPGEVLVWAESQGIRAMARIEVSPAPVVKLEPVVPNVAEVGETVELSARAFDGVGSALEHRLMRWSSSDPAVAEIVGDHQLKGRGAGIARISCNCEGKVASHEVAIVLPVVAKILIDPPPAHVDLGLPVPLHVQVVSARGVRIDRPLHWKAEPPQVASVDAKGVVIPLREGRATITASADGVEASVRLAVNPPPEIAMPSGDVSQTQVFELEEARRLLAQADPRFSVIGLTPIAPAASGDVENTDAPDEAAPTPNEDLVTVASDEAGVAADAGEIDDVATQAAAEPWESLSPASVYAESAPAERGGFMKRVGRARLVGAGVAVLAIALVTWRVAAFRGGAGDGEQVVASSGALADTAARAPITAPPAPVDSQPAAPSDSTAKATADSAAATAVKLTIAAIKPMHIGDSIPLRARLGADGKAKLGAINWTSSAPTIVRISRGGRLVAVKDGSATITGTANGATGTLTVRVLPGSVVLAGKAPVAQLLTSEVKSTLHPGDTLSLTAAPLGPGGESLLDRKVTWQSSHPEIASVDAYGLITARAPGSAEITATSEGKSSRVPVTVASRAVTFSDAPTAFRGGAERFVNAIHDRDGRELAAAFFVDSPDDQKNLDWLLAKLRASESNFRVTRAQQTGRPSIHDTDATSDYVFTFAWTQDGRNREQKAKFRLNARRVNDVWAIATLRAVDRIE